MSSQIWNGLALFFGCGFRRRKLPRFEWLEASWCSLPESCLSKINATWKHIININRRFDLGGNNSPVILNATLRSSNVPDTGQRVVAIAVAAAFVLVGARVAEPVIVDDADVNVNTFAAFRFLKDENGLCRCRGTAVRRRSRTSPFIPDASSSFRRNITMSWRRRYRRKAAYWL